MHGPELPGFWKPYQGLIEETFLFNDLGFHLHNSKDEACALGMVDGSVTEFATGQNQTLLVKLFELPGNGIISQGARAEQNLCMLSSGQVRTKPCAPSSRSTFVAPALPLPLQRTSLANRYRTK